MGASKACTSSATLDAPGCSHAHRLGLDRFMAGLHGGDNVRCDRVLTNIKNAETTVVALAVVVLMVVAVPLGQIR